MGLIEKGFDVLFGGQRNLIRETAGIFLEPADEGAERDAAIREVALDQYRQEFSQTRESRFDRFMNGVNRLPRPMLALGTLALFVSAMVAPLWFAERMQGIALVPEPLWWLMGAIISFYFGARHQVKGQAFQASVVHNLALAPLVAENVKALKNLRAGQELGEGETGSALLAKGDLNRALEDWRRSRTVEAETNGREVR